MSEKAGLETAAIDQFAEVMAEALGPGRFVFHQLRNPPEPDCRCSLDGARLDVEVAHVYGTETDAKRLLGRTGRVAPTEEDKQKARLTPMEARLLAQLNATLADKATKTYSSARVWLVVRNGLPLWTIEEFEAHRENIVVPQAHPFEQIWLLCGIRPSFGYLRLA